MRLVSRLVSVVLVALWYTTPCTFAALPALTSTLPIQAWKDLVDFTPEHVLSVVFGALPLPTMPTPQSIGENNVQMLLSGNRKMTLAEAKSRHMILSEFWKAKYPTIPFASVQAWSKPIYSQYLQSLGLQSKNVAHLNDQDFHRSVLLGMHIVAVLIQTTSEVTLALNHFSILDPMETRFFTGASAQSLKEVPNNNRLLRSRTLTNVVPSAYDMRASGQMPPIYSQQQCASSCK